MSRRITGSKLKDIQNGLLWKNKGKFFRAIQPSDLLRYQQASEHWENQKDALPYPKQAVPEGDKTRSGLLSHHYGYWHQMFNSRQLLLCVSVPTTSGWRRLKFPASRERWPRKCPRSS